MAKNVPAAANGNMPAHLAERMAQDAGRGVSTDKEDNLVPLIYILQAQSPQVNKRSPEYIEGAEAGSIWLRNHSVQDGEQGIIFQPCYFTKDWVEWRPNRGGYAGRHDKRPADAVEKPDPEDPTRTFWTLPSGNHVVETRYHIGHVFLGNDRIPYVIPMSSSGHTISRQWMSLMNSKRLGVGIAASWASTYRLKTKERSNARGTWFTWSIEDMGWVTSTEDYDLGKALNDAFESGAKLVADEHENHEASDAM